jgi:CRISPR-associated protein Csy1
MVDAAITDFFDKRKASWLKNKIKKNMSKIQTRNKEVECEETFSLKNWLPKAANRARQMSISTHPCTFSHPSSRKNKNGYASSIIAISETANDGFLRSGNVDVDTDALGNAAALDVYKFLTLVMDDGQTLLQHFEHDTELALNLLSLPNAGEKQNYQMLKKGFLAMTKGVDERITSSKIKQIFFPVTKQTSIQSAEVENYHQLSILTASGIVFELKKRLDGMRFGDDIKIARDKKKNGLQHNGYREIYNLTTIGYGGTKPQNISVLNSQNGGKAHLFISVPPQLNNRNIHFPNSDFFSQTVNYFQCKHQFYQLHKLYGRDDNNMHIRAERDAYYQSVIDHIIEKMWQTRSIALAQYTATENQLPSTQKIWLCELNEYKTLRDTTNDWLDDIAKSVTTFLFYGYEKILGNKSVKLSGDEHKHIHKLVLLNREALR